ncbi:PREDICTED: uncharacterized protein At3g60930, chloroplastic-like [Camelina sativa]|uniref:Uncharacterized protein At3g60930, chloroplastic-like n=1 Tax=Camelina sativa TaxID=90675 RepID=A0ABM1QHQ7_CAMSA|nr:PREDICTED: uncharacterized protein At3g60930, chloroplastic-like [Camelina sativa]
MSPMKSSSGKTVKPLIPGDYGPHQLSILSAENIAEFRGSTGIPPEIEIRFPKAHESLENPPPGYCCAFEIFFSACGLSFPLPELIVKMMFELGFALPQMCPNFVRIVMCLQTLGEEFDYKLSLADFLQVYTVKTGRTKGTLYVSPLSGLKVFDDLPEKDEKWRKSYFFFPVNELTFGHLSNYFERGLICPTFCEIFSKFCSQGQIAWDSFLCERIRKSTVRLRGRSLICSDPISTLEMNNREERACRLAEKEAKLNMAAALAEGKARFPTKKSSLSALEVGGTPASPAGPSELLACASGPSTDPSESPVIVIADSSDEPREFAARPTSARKPSAPPASPADLMRSYTRPGLRIPAFADMSELNRANFLRFADKIAKLMIEFNSSVASYEDQLFAYPSSSEVSLLKERIADQEAQVAEYSRLEAENADTVVKAEQIRAQMKRAEVEVLDLRVANEDHRDKLKKAGDLYFEAAKDAKAAKNRVWREEKRITFEEREKLAPTNIRAAEIRANRMLVEEISRGEIQDMEAELGLLRGYEEEADRKVSQVTPRDLDLSAFSDILTDTPELLCDKHPLSVTIDESGTNLGQMSKQRMDDFLANTRSEAELAEMALVLSEAASDPPLPTQ